MRRLVLLLGLVLGGAFARAEENPHVQAIELIHRDKETMITPVTIPLSSQPETTFDLEVGETIDHQLIRLLPQKGVTAAFRLEQSYETSLTIMAEGPHLDLVNWKHYISPWQPLKKLNATDFVARRISRAEAEKFPPVTPGEIRAAVKKFGGEEWTNQLDKIKGPNDYPAGVGLSTIRVRILMQEGRDWKVIHTVKFLVPMGC